MSLGDLFLSQFIFLMAARFTFSAPLFFCHIRSLLMFATLIGQFNFSEKYDKLDTGTHSITHQAGVCVTTGSLGR